MESYLYQNKKFPEYLKQGNACQYIIPIAKKFCKGKGLDIGGTKEAFFPDAEIINIAETTLSAFNLPNEKYDYIFSSHCLEHLDDPITALYHWKSRLKKNACLFLYLPHVDMLYWRPENNRKHLHTFYPKIMRDTFQTLGFHDIFFSERDLFYSFAITGKRSD